MPLKQYFDYQVWVEQNFRKQYLKALRDRLTRLLPSQKNEVCHEIERLTGELSEKNKAMIVDKASRADLGMTTIVLASYRALLPYINENETVINLLQDAFTSIGQRWIKLYTRLILRFSRDPFHTMIGVSQKRAKKYSGTFTFEYDGDGKTWFTSTVKKCFYHDFFVANDAPELTCVFCAGDKNWFDEIDPAKHGFKFERPTTLGYGGSECPFQFKRVER